MTKSSTPTRGRGRPTPIPPDGYVTITKAAELAGASYSTVYRLANLGKIKTTRRHSDTGARATRAEDSAWFVLATEIEEIKTHLRASDTSDGESRPAIMVRPNHDRLKAWQKQADKDGADRLSSWLMGLADKRAGL